MAVKFTKRYFSEAEYLYDTAAGTSKWFNQDDYNTLLQKDPDDALTYTYLHAGLSDKDTSNFDTAYYNMLSAEDRLAYINNEYYTDRNEMAVDTETGESYNVYNRTKEYLDYKFQEGADKAYFESLNGFEKVMSTIGGVLGNAVNALYSTVEGMVDLTLLIASGIANIGDGKIGAETEAGKKLKSWIGEDLTGTRAFSEHLQQFAKRNTYIDKNGFAKAINDVASGLTQMVPLVIPGFGQTLYFSGMAGNVAGEAVYENPDIDYSKLFFYTAGTTAIEFGTEKISSVLFGGSSVDKLFGGKATGGTVFSKIMKDFVSEGFEESISEFTGSILHDWLVSDDSFGNALFNVSMKDVLYAGLIGGIIGGIGAGLDIGTTQRITITKDFDIYTDKEIKALKKQGVKIEGERLSKTQTINFMEQFTNVENIAKQTDENLTKLKASTGIGNVDVLKKEYTEEYEYAIEKDRKIAEKKADAVSALAKIVDVIGIEGFQKAAALAEMTIQNRAAEADKYLNTLTGRNKQFAAVEAAYKAKNPGIGIKITGQIDAARSRLKTTVKKLYGVDVYFADIAWKDGLIDRKSLTLDENTIIIDNESFDTMSLQALIDTVVKEELVHTLQFESGILSPKNIYNLHKILQELGGRDVVPAELDAAYDADGKLERISEAQAKAIAQTLLFDELTVSKLFLADNATTSKVYKFLKNIKEFLQNKKKTPKETVKFRTVLERMKMYREAAVKNIGNIDDVQKLSVLLDLSEEESQELIDTYDPNFDTAHYSWMKDSYSVNTIKRKNAQEFLLKQRTDLNNSLTIKDPTTFNNALYRGIFDPDRYTQEARDQIFKINPPENMEHMSETELKDAFKYNLQDYLLTNYNVTINQEMGCLLSAFNLKDALNDDFIENMRTLSAKEPGKIDGYTNLTQIFDENFVRKFITEGGSNPLDEVTIQIQHTDEISVRKVGSYSSNKKLITLTIPNLEGKNLNAILYDSLLHEVHHALADIQGLPSGTSPERVKGALNKVSDADLLKLAKMLCTASGYEEIKNSMSLVKDYVAYGIYRITDGEYMAEAYATSKARTDDFEKRLKGNVAFNRSGFRCFAHGAVLQGYGRFKNFRLESTELMKIRSKISLSDLLQPKYVVAYAKENKLVTTLKAHGIDFKTANISDKFKYTINNLTKQDVFDDLLSNDIVSKNATPEERTKIIEAVTDYLSSVNEAFAVLNSTKIDWSKWSLTLKLEIAAITKERLYALISQDDIADRTATTQEKEALTNAIIDYVTDGKNEHMRTRTDLENATSLGLAYLELYEKYVATKDADKNKPHTFEEIKTAVESLIYKPEVEAAVIKIYSTVTNKEINERNSILKQKLLKSDFDYSLDAYHKLMAEMSQGLKSKTEVSDEITKDTGSDEKKVSITDTIQVKSFNQEKTYDMETSEGQQTDEKLTKKAIKAAKDQIEALQNSPEIFKLRNTFEKTQKDNFIKLYGQQAYDAVLKMMPKKSNLDAKVKNLREKIEQSTLSDVTKQQLLTRDTTEFGLTQYNEYIEEMQTALGIAPKEKFVPKKQTVEKVPTRKKTTVAEQKTEVVENKKETVEEKTEALFKEIVTYETTTKTSNSDLAQKFITAVEKEPEILNEVQKVSTQQKHAIVSDSLLDSMIAMGAFITKENFDDVRKQIASSDSKFSGEALNLFDEVIQNTAFEDAEFTEYVNSFYEKQVSLAGQKLSRHARYVAEYKPISNLVKTLKDHRYQAVVTQEMLENIEPRLKEKDKMIAELTEKITSLKEEIRHSIENEEVVAALSSALVRMEDSLLEKQKTLDEMTKKDTKLQAEIEDLRKQISEQQKAIIKTTREGLTDLERQDLMAEAKKAAEDKIILERGNAIDIADWLIRNIEDLEDASRLTNDMMSNLIRKAIVIQEEGSEADVYKLKNEELQAFPKTREWLLNVMDKLKSYRMWAMLSSPVTWVRNFFGNAGMTVLDLETGLFERLFTKIMDKKGAFKDGTQLKYRSTSASRDAYLYIAEKYKHTIQAIIDGEDVSKFKEMSAEKAIKLNRELLKKELEDTRGIAKIIPLMKLGTDWGLSSGPFGDNRAVTHAIIRNIGDLLASNMDVWESRYSTEYKTLSNKRKLSEHQQKRLIKLKAFIENQNIETLLDVMTKEELTPLFDNAKTRAFEQYFKNSNKLSEWLFKFGKQHPMAAGLINWVLPFPKVSYNIITMAVKYSPIGFAKALFQWSKSKQAIAAGKATGFEYAELSRTLSQATVGTINFVAGVILAALGAIDIDEDDYMGPSLKIGDLKISLSELAPSATTLSVGAAMLWAWKNDKSATKAALDVIYDNTLLGNVENIFRYSSPEQYLQNLSISYLSQYIPSSIKLITKLTDWSTKDKTGNYWNKLIKTLGSYIPGVSYAVPNKVNPYTGEKTYRSGTRGWFNIINAISPLTMKVVDKSELERTAISLNAETTGLSGTFTINDKQYKLVNNEKNTMAKYRATYIQTEYNNYLSGKTKITVKTSSGDYKTTTWDNLTNAEKKSALESLYTKATTNTKINYWLSQGNYYYTSNKDEYYRLREQFNNSQKIQYRKNWKTSKFVEK